jgi:hypothetical protein
VCGQPPGWRQGRRARDRQVAGAEKETLAPSGMKEAASVGVRNVSLAVAGPAFNGIDFAARLCRLHHHREARSIARNARMLFDLLRHVEPFRPATKAAYFFSYSEGDLPSSSSIIVRVPTPRLPQLALHTCRLACEAQLAFRHRSCCWREPGIWLPSRAGRLSVRTCAIERRWNIE